MQAVPSTYHQCVKFPHNGAEIVVPGDNAIAINTLTAAETFVPHNKPSPDHNASLVAMEQKLKMMSIGMGEYTLDSIAAMPTSPKSYGRPSDKAKPSASAMTVFGTFVQSSVPLEAEKEEQVLGSGSIERTKTPRQLLLPFLLSATVKAINFCRKWAIKVTDLLMIMDMP
jgi:hypothetical protein